MQKCGPLAISPLLCWLVLAGPALASSVLTKTMPDRMKTSTFFLEKWFYVPIKYFKISISKVPFKECILWSETPASKHHFKKLSSPHTCQDPKIMGSFLLFGRTTAHTRSNVSLWIENSSEAFFFFKILFIYP